MKGLRHIEDKIIRSGSGIPWPLSDVSQIVEFRTGTGGLGGTWNIQFMGALTAADSYIEIPINPNVDYCWLSLTGTIQSPISLSAGNQFSNNEGSLYCWAWGYEDPNQTQGPINHPVAVTKYDAWGASCMGCVAQFPNGLPPFFGYSGPSLNTATIQSRITPVGFLVNRSSTGVFNMVAGDRFSVQFPVGRLRMGELSVSGLQTLYVRLACINPSLLSYDPLQDKLTTSLVLTASYFEARSSDIY